MEQQTDHGNGLQARGQERRREGQPLARTTEPASVRPIRCDVYENDVEYLILAELPGMDREACDVSVHDRELRIRAERDDQGDGVVRFARTFTLPYNADPAEVKATARDGVLRITVGKTRESRPRRIQIEG